MIVLKKKNIKFKNRKAKYITIFFNILWLYYSKVRLKLLNSTILSFNFKKQTVWYFW